MIEATKTIDLIFQQIPEVDDGPSDREYEERALSVMIGHFHSDKRENAAYCGGYSLPHQRVIVALCFGQIPHD